MKIKIDQSGTLQIWRRGKYRNQSCPFAHDGVGNCGDWCPLFSIYEDIMQDELEQNYEFKELRLCQASYPNVIIEYEQDEYDG